MSDLRTATLPNETIIAILSRRAIDETLPVMYTTEQGIKKALRESLSSAALLSKQWHACTEYVYHRLYQIFLVVSRQKKLTDFLKNHLRTLETVNDQTFVVDTSGQFYHEYSVWPRGPIWSVHRLTEKGLWSLYSHDRNTYHTLPELREILIPTHE